MEYDEFYDSDMTSPSPDLHSGNDSVKEEVGIGLSNPSISQGRRKMLDLVNKLHNTGVQVDIDLPQIAVIGSQSAGKSSLIEAISGITLPRASGTCTRCPTECRLSHSEGPWQCTVTLRYTLNPQGRLLGQPRIHQFGPTIYKKNEVEDRIRRAQLAILNPSKNPDSFLGNIERERNEISFSPNSICLQISGPDVADLSFCDLPGLIASVTTDQVDGTIALVESLIKSYIARPNCIILLTVACETDFENQGAHRLVKQHDPEGKRTIGVLTKPDRIPKGEERNWLPFIRNDKEPLTNRWHCVKQPSSADLAKNVTYQQARSSERAFFDTYPWSGLDVMHQQYLGTHNLVQNLSFVLSDLIAKSLPKIKEELEKTLLMTRRALHALPKAPSSDPGNEISQLIHAFVIDLARHVEGVPHKDGILQTVRPLHDAFRIAIRSTAPNFRPFEKTSSFGKHLNRAKFLVDEEGEAFGDEASDSEEAPNPFKIPPPSNKVEIKRGKIYVDEVLDKAHQARTRELPGSYPFVVQMMYIQDFVKLWRDPCTLLSNSVNDIMAQHVRRLVQKHFSQYGQGTLEQRVGTIIQQHLMKCRARALDKVDWLLQLEDYPFSLNTHYLSDYKSKFLAHYKGSRERYERGPLMSAISLSQNASQPPPSSPPSVGVATNSFFTTPTSNAPAVFAQGSQLTGIGKVIAALAEIGVTGIKPEDIPKLFPADKMEGALTIMADVRAYFHVAYKRFSDIIPLAIDHELVRGVERNVLDALNSGLGINGPGGHKVCQEFAQENPQTAASRADLQKKLARLETANRELFNLSPL